MNGIVKNLGPENGRTISKKGIKKGLPLFTGPTNFSLGRIAGKYTLSYRTEKDEKGNIIKYIFTTQYGDPENPTEYHELWWDPMEEKMMNIDYRTAIGMGLEPHYRYLTDKEARNAAVLLRKELNDENALEAAPLGTSATEGGRRTRKQKRNRKQKRRNARAANNLLFYPYHSMPQFRINIHNWLVVPHNLNRKVPQILTGSSILKNSLLLIRPMNRKKGALLGFF